VHPIHCAVVAAVAAQTLRWPSAQVTSLVGAALTMNAAFIELQNLLSEELDPPTRKQMEQIRAHPQASADLLRAAGVTDADWLQTVVDHHERCDGQGYPRGASDIGDAAVLLRLVDVYMAKISPRRLRPALNTQQSAQQLFQQHGKHPREGPFAMAFIRSLGGPYPPGALVQLRSGEVAVVARRPASGTAPSVATLSNPRGEPVVATQLHDSAAADWAITGPLPDSSRFQRILPERIYGMLLAP
jgi:HD-GYP domain-containing protein (c-di-GMP phosphodiesterase class II)